MEKTQEIKNNWYQKQLANYEVNRYGAMTLMITLQSCWGSIAAMYSLVNESFISLGIVAVMTLASNAAFIAQSPAKWCLNIFYTSLIVSTIVLFVNLFI